MRKLPVYLLLDTSGSMYGEPLEAVKAGVETLVQTLRQDPYALETACLSVITFASDARQAAPLQEVMAFEPPTLIASGQTAMGAALNLLAERVDAEVAQNTRDKKGDWKPLVFIMSDGAPTDDLEAGLAAMKSRKFGMVIACAAGSRADVGVLKRITDTVVRLDTLDMDSVKAFFKWVSASVSSGSARVDAGQQPGEIQELPPPPEEVIFV